MPKASQIYFISGVCVVGKSAVITDLKTILPPSEYDVHDFDERGVPDGGGFDWHSKETLRWLEVGGKNAANNISTIICGFQNPEEFNKLHNKEIHAPAKLLLLHASGDTIRKRLLGRYPTPESIAEINRASGEPLNQFVEDNISFAPTLRAIFEKEGAPIIDTDAKTPEEVAREIVKLLQ